MIVIDRADPVGAVGRGRGDAGHGRRGGVDDDRLFRRASRRARCRQGEDGGVGVGATVSKIVPPLSVRAQRCLVVVELGAVLAGGDGVGEGQRAGAAAAGVARRAAGVERQLRRAGDDDASLKPTVIVITEPTP